MHKTVTNKSNTFQMLLKKCCFLKSKFIKKITVFKTSQYGDESILV